MHALKSGMDVKAYAEKVGRPRQSVSVEVCAARVADSVPHMWHDLPPYTRHLALFHGCHQLWRTLALDSAGALD